jgi:hypothetical protein
MFAVLDTATWALLFTTSEWLIRLVRLMVVPMRRTPAAAKGWLLLILFLPWPGLIVYLLGGSEKGVEGKRVESILTLKTYKKTPDPLFLLLAYSQSTAGRGEFRHLFQPLATP